MNRYYIIGAGLSGLRIAQLLALGGKRVDIFEMDSEVGGLMKTEKRDDFLFDIGPHIFFKDYAEEYRRLIGNDLHNIKVQYGIGFRGKDITSPIHPTNLFKNLGLKQGLPMIWDMLQCKLSNGKKAHNHLDTAESWARSRFGENAYQSFFIDYIPKVMGLPAAMVTEEWGTERKKFYKEHNLWQKSSKLLLHFFMNKKNGNGYLDVYYPKYGAQQIPEVISKEVKKLGGEIHLRTKVKKIEVCKNWVRSMLVTKDGIDRQIQLDNGSFVLSTMPITGLFKKLVSVDRDIGNEKKASENLSYRNLWLFNLVVKRESLKDKAQIYFPEAKYIFKRVYEPKNLLEGSTNQNRTAICVEVCYNKGDEIESMKEGELYSRVLLGLKDFYNITEADIVDMWSKKVPYAYSIYELDYKEKLKTLAQYLFEIENLISFGRQGSFRYNHMTNRIMDACNILHNFMKQEKPKRDFMISPDPKSSFF